MRVADFVEAVILPVGQMQRHPLAPQVLEQDVGGTWSLVWLA